MTKQLEVPLICQQQKPPDIKQISAFLDNIPKHSLDNAPWPEFSYVPEVSFSIAHNNNFLFIKYFVFEATLKTTFYKTNDPVYKDSCVEFFVAFNGEKAYYNFEFNAIGTCKLNFGTNRHNRIIISDKVIRSIKYLATIQNKNSPEVKEGIQWDLTLMIPVEAFSEHKIDSLSGKKCAANFYKCGDDLPVPHFVTWNYIDSVKPDFHLPEYFGELVFL